MRHWIFDRDRTPQGRPLRRLLDRVVEVTAPDAVSIRVIRAQGYGQQITAWLDVLDEVVAIDVPLALLAELSLGTDEWFYDLEAQLGDVTFGLHDSDALFVDGPIPLVQRILSAFTNVKASGSGRRA